MEKVSEACFALVPSLHRSKGVGLLYAGRTCLHHAAAYGHEECVERLLEKHFDPLVQDHKGETALHLAAIQGCPMSAFNLTKAAPITCLAKNQKQQRPADVAKACERGEVSLLSHLLASS